MLLSSSSQQIIKDNMRNNKELENVVTNVRLDEQIRLCRIPFEDYINMWMKIATTNPEVLMSRELTLDELITYTQRFADPYRSSVSEACDHIQSENNCNNCLMHSPVQKLKNKDSKRKLTRVEKMRRVYMQCKAQELLSPQKIPGSVQDTDGQEHWEQEMDELVAWTHSLSMKELDDL